MFVELCLPYKTAPLGAASWFRSAGAEAFRYYLSTNMSLLAERDPARERSAPRMDEDHGRDVELLFNQGLNRLELFVFGVAHHLKKRHLDG